MENDKRQENVNLVDPRDKIPLSEKIIYGAADLFGGGQATMLSLLLLIFFTDIIGISAAYAGTVILVSKLWDAVSDPMCGIISDNLRTKMGRRKPFMIVGGILIIPALAFLFAPIQNLGSQAAKVAFAAAAYVVYCTVSTISQVPYMSMSSDISCDYRERNIANLIKLGFDMLAAVICYLAPSMLFEALKEGRISQTAFYLIIVFGFGLMFGAPLVIAGFVVKERAPYPAEKSRFDIKGWINSFKVKSFKYHILMYIGSFLSMDLISNLALYYVANVLRGVQLFGREIGTVFIIAPMMVLAGLAIPVYFILMQKKTKQFSYRAGIPLYIAGVILLAVYQTNWPAWIVLAAAAMMGIGFGGAQMMPWIVFPDTIEVAELKLGYRPTGNFSGIMTFSRKISTALAIQIVGLGLTWAGYQPGTAGEIIVQPHSVLIAIRIMLGVSVTLFLLMGFYASVRYKVTNKKLDRIRCLTDAAREGRELTEEEAKEKEALIKELA
ncbi:MAG TPA: MFS transporter [Clostridia bacterium]|jgi:Na+/melibiose symporter-like transporter|nr:MFS transporter [Clostridia bacterium]HOL61206.1 MFS transporter [Clostridia bacterium]HPO53884.1 MFS transporter [Clostridia bacterium]